MMSYLLAEHLDFAIHFLTKNGFLAKNRALGTWHRNGVELRVVTDEERLRGLTGDVYVLNGVHSNVTSRVRGCPWFVIKDATELESRPLPIMNGIS